MDISRLLDRLPVQRGHPKGTDLKTGVRRAAGLGTGTVFLRYLLWVVHWRLHLFPCLSVPASTARGTEQTTSEIEANWNLNSNMG